MRHNTLMAAVMMALSLAQAQLLGRGLKMGPKGPEKRPLVAPSSWTWKRTRAYRGHGQREELRAFRRAQGGPGIELTAGVWHPRNPAGLQGDGQ